MLDGPPFSVNECRPQNSGRGGGQSCWGLWQLYCVPIDIQVLMKSSFLKIEQLIFDGVGRAPLDAHLHLWIKQLASDVQAL